MNVVTLSILLALVIAQDSAAGPIACPKTPGLIVGPYVPNATVARQIFNAVASVLQRDGDKYKIEVREKGEDWVMYQVPKDDDEFTLGRGGLAMHINKCNGSLSEVHYER